MESSNSFEIFLWLIAALLGMVMVAVLIIGWLKGNQWQREGKMKNRQTLH